MKIISKYIILALIISLFIVACGNKPDVSPHYINGFKYNDPEYQEKIITEIQHNGIPIVITKEGFATYPDSHTEKVKEILNEMDKRPYSEFYKKKYADNFVELLEENHLEYSIKHLKSNKVQVYWNTKDDEFVRELKDKNLKIIFER